MILHGKSKKLTVIIGQNEQVYQRPLFEAIVFAAKKYKLSGVTVSRGIMSYGADSLIQSVKVFDLADDMPVVIEMVDVPERIEDFAGIASKLMEKADSGGIVYFTDVDVFRYSGNKSL